MYVGRRRGVRGIGVVTDGIAPPAPPPPPSVPTGFDWSTGQVPAFNTDAFTGEVSLSQLNQTVGVLSPGTLNAFDAIDAATNATIQVSPTVPWTTLGLVLAGMVLFSAVAK